MSITKEKKELGEAKKAVNGAGERLSAMFAKEDKERAEKFPGELGMRNSSIELYAGVQKVC
jgi:hypothetical protein